ncbi:hypothetical protein P9112_008795 [Eukaryota sp. TZLM1-RC]
MTSWHQCAWSVHSLQITVSSSNNHYWEDLLMTTQSSTVFALNEEISKIDVEKWGRCFPQSFDGNIPEKNVLNLKYTLRTLQKRLTGMYEKDLYNNICSSAVLNQDLHSLLLEKSVCENQS